MGATAGKTARVTQERSCGTCTKCCDGWLSATIYGQEVNIGSPCRFAQGGKGCSIYQDRPVDPCVKFECLWLQDETVPDWIKPEEAGVIAFIRTARNPATRTKRLVVKPAGSAVTEEYRAWAKMYAKQHELHYIEEQ